MACLHNCTWSVINSRKVCDTGQVRRSLVSRGVRGYFSPNKPLWAARTTQATGNSDIPDFEDIENDRSFEYIC